MGRRWSGGGGEGSGGSGGSALPAAAPACRTQPLALLSFLQLAAGTWYDTLATPTSLPRRRRVTQYHDVAHEFGGWPASASVQILTAVALVGAAMAQVLACANNTYYLLPFVSKRRGMGGSCVLVGVVSVHVLWVSVGHLEARSSPSRSAVAPAPPAPAFRPHCACQSLRLPRFRTYTLAWGGAMMAFTMVPSFGHARVLCVMALLGTVYTARKRGLRVGGRWAGRAAAAACSAHSRTAAASPPRRHHAHALLDPTLLFYLCRRCTWECWRRPCLRRRARPSRTARHRRARFSWVPPFWAVRTAVTPLSWKCLKPCTAPNHL